MCERESQKGVKREGRGNVKKGGGIIKDREGNWGKIRFGEQGKG